MFDFAKEWSCDEKALGIKNTRYKPLIRILQSLAIIAGSLKKKFSSTPKTQDIKKSKTRFLSSNRNDFCDRIKLLLQEKQGGNSSDKIKEKISAVADKLLEYKCLSTKRH